jgi:hypothetical protein
MVASTSRRSKSGGVAVLLLLVVASFSLTSCSALSIPRPQHGKLILYTRPSTNTRLSMSDAAAAVPAGGAQDDEGTATIPNEVFNLVKSIVGAGVLSLPAGTYVSFMHSCIYLHAVC